MVVTNEESHCTAILLHRALLPVLLHPPSTQALPFIFSSSWAYLPSSLHSTHRNLKLNSLSRPLESQLLASAPTQSDKVKPPALTRHTASCRRPLRWCRRRLLLLRLKP
ncbi:hypothetical protein A9K55_001899 [Cordyceps militaris]|uniref:Uncharacterized protein n=1 Tax=Cordyceps militaris TaxID=73501 RepID=A0A2H4ST17_CORMI|nr:hypothetical protein A9K55_001899 [Cordyceps militaris]